MAKAIPPRVSNQESPHERDTRSAISQLSSSPLLSGALVKVTFAAATPIRVQHNLGRVARGFFPVAKAVTADVWAATGMGTASYITLTSNAAATITLWVF